MNKQEYIEWRDRKRRILRNRYFNIGPMVLMFVGLPLAAIAPTPWNVVALLVPYFMAFVLITVIPWYADQGIEDALTFVRKAVEAYNE